MNDSVAVVATKNRDNLCVSTVVAVRSLCTVVAGVIGKRLKVIRSIYIIRQSDENSNDEYVDIQRFS